MSEIPSGFKVLNPEPLDGWSGPYSGATESEAKAAALAAVPSAVRYPTMEVTLVIGGSPKKYWFSPSIVDGDMKEIINQDLVTEQVGVATQKANEASEYMQQAGDFASSASGSSSSAGNSAITATNQATIATTGATTATTKAGEAVSSAAVAEAAKNIVVAGKRTRMATFASMLAVCTANEPRDFTVINDEFQGDTQVTYTWDGVTLFEYGGADICEQQP